MSENDMIERLTRVVAHARKNGIFVTAMPWDDYRAPLDFLERMYKSLVYDGGADHVTMADTLGMGLPWTTAYIVGKMKEWVPGVPIEWHAHNDYGLATSIMLSAVSAGASVVHTSMNSLGERAGNAATEEVVIGLELFLGLDTGIKTEKLYEVSRMVSELAKIPLPMNKPVVGDNEFTFESGQVIYSISHLRGTKGAYCPMPFAPEYIGRKRYNFVLGKMSGSYIIAERLKELGLSASKEQVTEILETVKREASIRKWSIPDDLFETIAREILQQGK
jgi:2-isopropylmalate synthase